jgi:predicted ATP-binding protein involved in virulence
MKISKLSLINYRGAQSLPLDFSEKLNVFFGVNGAGKSTVLDSLAIMLSWAVSRIRAGGSGRPILETDIANWKAYASIELCCFDEDRNFKWRISKGRRGIRLKEQRSYLTDLKNFTEPLQDEIISREGNINLPLFVYYPVNRTVLDIPLRIRRKHRFTLLSAYDNALISGANFRTFFEWFRNREDLENENRKYIHAFPALRPEGFVFPDPQLEAVRSALKQFLPEFGNLSVRRDPLRMEVEKEGRRLTVNQLSDGEKCLIAMIGDLARRMAIANPAREKPLEGQGIVLIDEIDLHLHPKWQRMVVTKLPDVFPNCQFVISTHSPHVITHVSPDNLYKLKLIDGEIIATRPTESYGKNVDRILEDLMGLETTRPVAIKVKLRDIFRKIKDGQLTEAREELAALRIEIGGDPELVKAEVLIRRKEIIGK